MEFDNLDLGIINALEENSRLSLRKIAKKCGVSVATVMHRLQHIEREKAIKYFSVVPDYEKLGFNIQAIVDVIVSKGMLFQVEKKIASHPSVAAVYDVTGHFDVMVIAYFRSRRGLDEFLKKIQAFDFVEKTETRVVLNTIKEGAIKV